MCLFMIGVFFLAVLLVGLFHGELSFWVAFVLICIVFSIFGRYAHNQRQIDLTREQLEYYKKKNQEKEEEE